MTPHFSNLEKRCIRVFAVWFEHNMTQPKPEEIQRLLGIRQDAYEPLIETMIAQGFVRRETVTGQGSILSTSWLVIQPAVVQAARELARQVEEAQAPKDIVEQVSAAARRHPYLAWGLVAFFVLAAAITFLNQLLGVLEKVGNWSKPNSTATTKP